MLDEHALELERGDAIVRRLEDVVGPTDVRDVPVAVTGCDVPGVIEAVAHRFGGVLAVVAIPDHQRQRSACEIDADLTGLTVGSARRIDEIDHVAGERPAHRARLDRLSHRVGDLCGGLGLPVPVANDESPCSSYLLDDLRVERLPGAAPL